MASKNGDKSLPSQGKPKARDETAPGGKYGYRLGHKKGDYEIPDVVLNAHRNIKVITIGAGISGIYMAYLIQKYGSNIEHVIYEKNGDIGGTWLENRYPGCACDVPSHAYSYGFALNADWPKFYSASEDIFRYLDRVVECFGLRKFMTFNSAITSCRWEEDEGKWHVEIQDSVTGETRKDVADVVVGAVGVLNSWKMPNEIQDLHSFTGRLIHTARWPESYQKEQWTGERVAVIGSGASSIQVVPEMQPDVKQMQIYVRTPVWFTGVVRHEGDNFKYSDTELQEFKTNPEKLVGTAKEIESQLNSIGGLKMHMTKSREALGMRKYVTERMRNRIQRDDIFEKLLPDYAVGCRRLTIGNEYLRAVQKDNVEMHKAAVVKVTPNSVIDSNGNEREVDTIICATGFDVSFRPRYPILGRNGINLQDKWNKIPETYLSVAIPEFPNYFTIAGPVFPIANGSVMGPLQAVSKYILKMVQKMQKEGIHSIAPKEKVTQDFIEHTQTWIGGSAWADPRCRSWHKDNETGRVNAIWPGSSVHFCEMMEQPRYEDFEIKYHDKQNMWSFLGLGFTQSLMTKGGDLSPYMSKDTLEPSFLEYKPDKEKEEERVRRREQAVHNLKSKL